VIRERAASRWVWLLVPVAVVVGVAGGWWAYATLTGA